MSGAFFYLTVCSIRNRLRKRLRRLREPRYLIGSVVGVLYLYYFVFHGAFRRRGAMGSTGTSAASATAVLAHYAAEVHVIGAAVLFVLAALAWLWPGSKSALTFSRAEVQFLFQAPLARRQLMHYKLIRTQVATVFGSAVATLFLRPSTMAGGWIFVTGLWLTLSIISLHAIGVSLSRQSVTRFGRLGLARQWLPIGVLGGAIAVLVETVVFDWSRLVAFTNAGDVFVEMQRLASTGPAAVVLWPFFAIVRVPLAASTVEYWAALPWALLILVANYFWVIRADAAFEEASAERAEKTAQRLASPRAMPTVKARISATPFTLGLTGRPETAILWKNLIMLGRYASLKTVMRFVPMLIVLGVMASRDRHAGGLLAAAAILCLVFLLLTVILGPQMARNDLRQDLASLAVLKTWPMSGATLLRGQLLAPAVTLTAIAWLLICGAAALTMQLPFDHGTAVTVTMNRVSYALAAMCIAPGIIVAQLVVQNGFAVMFPAWVTVGSSRSRGVDVMGQRLLMMAGNLLTLLLSLLPAAIVGGGVAVAIYATTGTVWVVLPAGLVALVMFAESWLAIEAFGRVLDRTDVSALEAVE
jgi:hypothetical protein